MVFNVSKIVRNGRPLSQKYMQIVQGSKTELDSWSKKEILNTLELHKSKLIDATECTTTIQTVLG